MPAGARIFKEQESVVQQQKPGVSWFPMVCCSSQNDANQVDANQMINSIRGKAHRKTVSGVSDDFSCNVDDDDDEHGPDEKAVFGLNSFDQEFLDSKLFLNPKSCA